MFEDCWAGVYVDSVAGMALHLHEGGRAFQSPGAEVAISGSDGTVRCQLWWRADEDTLRMVDCTGLPFRWPGAADDLLRDPPRPGRLAGFSVGGDVGIASIGDSPSGNDSMLNAESFGEVSLVRDPSGFLFPGCMYALYLRGGSSSSCGARGARGVGDVDFRVVLGADGGLTHGASGERIATLSYAPPRLSTVGSSGAINSGASGAWWATGHAIVLRLMVKHREVRICRTNINSYDTKYVLNIVKGFQTKRTLRSEYVGVPFRVVSILQCGIPVSSKVCPSFSLR